MSISDKTRKILWGRSANRCAFCRRELVINATPADDDSVVGDECHIISPRPGGPRHVAAVPQGKIDHTSNLLLLCRVHHKMVDDQPETYSVELLRDTKRNHEKWVASSLTESKKDPPIQLSSVVGGSPSHLKRVMSGRELAAILDDSCAYDSGHDEPESPEEVDLVASFLQHAQDYGDLSGEFDSGERVRWVYDLTEALRELEKAGFWVFAGQEPKQLEGGALREPTPFPIALLRVLRSTSPTIIKVGEGSSPGDA